MTRLLYQEDSYLREFDARVVRVEGDRIYLDATAFHPRPSGGLANDTGYLVRSGDDRLRVIDVVEDEAGIAHIVSPEDDAELPTLGEEVHGVIDWDRRYRMMRLHTASHIIAAVLYKKYNALVTGGYIEPGQARDDFDLTSAGQQWKEALRWSVEEANRIASQCLPVKVYWLPREDALRIPGLVKLAERMPPSVERLRIVEIPGVDIQADGAPHVRDTCEIGRVRLLRIESKGRRRRRLYYTVEP